MNPSSVNVFKLISSDRLGEALRGDVCVFSSPAHINDDMRPTDHEQLLVHAIYPLAKQYGVDFIREELERAIRGISINALGVFCAIQCFYIEIVREDAQVSLLELDRKSLPKFLGCCFIRETEALHSLEVRAGDIVIDRSYKVTLSRMRILSRDHKIDWGVPLPKL